MLILASLTLGITAFAAETSITLKHVHLCWAVSRRGVEHSLNGIEGVARTADKDSATVTLTGPNQRVLQKAANAMAPLGEELRVEFRNRNNTTAPTQPPRSPRLMWSNSRGTPENGLTWPAASATNDAMRITSLLKSLALALACLSCRTFAADAPATFKVGEFTFTRPATWEWVETTSSMRKAQLKIADKERKESVEVVFFHFGEGSGGGTKANVDRWFGQFQEPKDQISSKVEDVTVGKRKVTYVQAEGTYLSGMPGGPKTAQPNAMLLGAIAESEAGNVFIKLTGPAKLASSARDDLRKMVEGALKAP